MRTFVSSAPPLFVISGSINPGTSGRLDLTGIRYDAVDKVLHIRPKIPGDHASFLSTATGYGLVGEARFEDEQGEAEAAEELNVNGPHMQSTRERLNELNRRAELGGGEAHRCCSSARRA